MSKKASYAHPHYKWEMLRKQVLEAEVEQRLFQSLNTIDGELLSTFSLLQMPAVTGVRLEESTTGQKDSTGI